MEKSVLTPVEQYVVDYILKLRIEKDLTQADIGYIIGVKQSFIANAENRKNRAKYNLNHINKLADHFGTSPRDLLPEKSFLS